MKLELTQEQLAQVINVNLPLGVLLDISNGREQSLGVASRLAALRQDRPAIGTKGLYGIYAGIARGYVPHTGPVDNSVDAIIEVLDEAPAAMTWDDAKKWAESVGGRLPTRKEQALLFANVPELFKEEAYWSCEPSAGNESSAWYQSFSNGHQDGNRKGNELLARAVRRLPIE